MTGVSSTARERSLLRSDLKSAKRGNNTAFNLLVSHYFDFATESFFILGWCEDEERTQVLQTLFCSLWRSLRFIRRLSDFERALVVQCQTLSSTKSRKSSCVRTVRSLDSDAKLLLVACEMERWSMHSLRLAFRSKTREIRRRRLELRSQLLKIDLSDVDKPTMGLLKRVNLSLDTEFSNRHRKNLIRAVAKSPIAKHFKAGWLLYRGEMVELRHQMRSTDEECTQFLEKLLAKVSQAPMEKPTLGDRLVNTIHFTRFPKPA
jgi:hypothetical protein